MQRLDRDLTVKGGRMKQDLSKVFDKLLALGVYRINIHKNGPTPLRPSEMPGGWSAGLFMEKAKAKEKGLAQVLPIHGEADESLLFVLQTAAQWIDVDIPEIWRESPGLESPDWYRERYLFLIKLISTHMEEVQKIQDDFRCSACNQSEPNKDLDKDTGCPTCKGTGLDWSGCIKK